jgi:S-formylglutathione hydrolase FrmB
MAVKIPRTLLLLAICPSLVFADGALQFEIKVAPQITSSPTHGRLFVVLSTTNQPEPRLRLGHAGAGAPLAWAIDCTLPSPAPTIVDAQAYGFPLQRLSALPAGDYFVQALFDSSRDLHLRSGPGNLYSTSKKLHVDSAITGTIQLTLDHVVPPEQVPADTDQIKYIRIQSRLLSEFHQRPIFLRASVLLPRDYSPPSSPAGKRYPLWVRIGGLDTRYTALSRALTPRSEFRHVWLDERTPRFLCLQLDGAGPYGDPYYVDSENNGPFGAALTQELIPEVERRFGAIGQGRGRVLSGASTGGWVALALQIFYPDFFNGAWSGCPDPVDFHSLELINIYKDTNAFVNVYGYERPSERDIFGDIKLSTRREVQAENLLGRGNSFTAGGGQWGAWNAVFSPRGANGLPAAIWDPHTGTIDRRIAEHWKKYDLSFVLQQHWKTLEPKLRGKLHITAGEADDYFLNYAVHRLEEVLVDADPPMTNAIVYGPGMGHGWSNLTLPEILNEMQAAVDRASHLK